MAEIIRLTNGRVETVSDIRDVLDLVGMHLGDDARRWIETHLSRLESREDSEYIDNLEDEVKNQKEHHHEVVGKLWTEAEKIASLIREKNIDRRALSTAAGKISSITWRELNV